MSPEIPVRVGVGPVHIGWPVPAGYRTVCWQTLKTAKPVSHTLWQRKRRCADCDEAASRARSSRDLRRIAGI